MTFAWPFFLWLLALPAGIAAWDLARRRSDSTLQAPPRILRGEAGARMVTLSDVPISRLGRLRIARPWLLLGIACATLALARPQWGVIEDQVFDQSREIVLALDLSRSMLTPDVKPSRLERSKLLIQALLDRLSGERVGLVVFSGTAFLQCPLSADYEILREFLPTLNPKYLPEGGTNYSALLQTALEAFAGGNGAADRFLIILSDGEALDEQWREKIEELKKRGVRTLCLGVGTAQGGVIPDGDGGFVKDERGAVVLSKLANGTLQELASATGGVYRDASSWIDLPRLLQDTVEAGRRGRFEEKREVRRIERFQWALAPALLLLLVSWWREFPVQVRARTVQLTPPKASGSGGSMPEGRPPNAGAALGAWLLLTGCLTSFLGVPSPVDAAAAAGAPPSSTLPATSSPGAVDSSTPLALTVKRLAGLASPSARDWAAMASDSLAWGQSMQAAQQKVPAGPVQDGLAAAWEGERLDPKAADWGKLKNDLAALLENPPSQDPRNDKNKDKNQSQSENKKNEGKDDKDAQKKDSGQKSDPGSDNQGDKQPQQSKQQDQQKRGSRNDSPENQDAQQQNARQDSAFGDMKQPPTAPEQASPRASQQEMQKVGGQENKNQAEQADPSLTLPLQKLEKIKEQDSPARLFQILEGQKKKGPPAPAGRNW